MTLVNAAALMSLGAPGFIIAAIIFAVLSDLCQSRRWFLLAGYFLAGLIFLMLIYTPSIPFMKILVSIVSIGFLLGVIPLCTALVYDYTTPSSAGFAFSIFLLIGIVVRSLTIMLTRSSFQPIHEAATTYTLASWQNTVVIIPILLIIGALMSVFLRIPKTAVND